MTSNKKFTFDVFTIAENFWFLIFCTNKQLWIAMSRTIQSANLKRKQDWKLRKNRTCGNRAET